MASSLVFKRIASSSSSSLFNPNRYISVTRFTPSVTRSFNTNAQMTSFDDGGDDRTADVDRGADRAVFRRRGRDFGYPSVFSDVFDPFSPTRSLSQVLNLMEKITENPFLAASQGMGGGRSWDVKEDNEALHLRMDMPGVSKDNVQVSVEQNTLVIKGEGEKDSEDEKGSRRYSSRIDLPSKTYKVDDIKAEMKNGVLKVVVPKVKEEERKNVFQVNVE